MTEQIPANNERQEALSPLALQVGHEALEAELAAGRELQVHDAIDKVAGRFPLLGSPQEALALNIGREVTVPILNYGDKPITDEIAATLARAVERVAWVVGPNNMEKMGTTIALTAGDSIEPGSNNMANADKDSRILRIATGVFESGQYSERMNQDYAAMVGTEVPLSEITLVHEFGHIAEFAATESREDDSDPRLVSDLFAGTAAAADAMAPAFRKQGSVPIPDASVKVFEDGMYVEKLGAEAYGDQASVEAPSAYGRKKPGEYFAESFVGYAYDGNISEPLKDMVRAGIDAQMPGGRAMAGPVEQARFERVGL